MGLNDFKLNGGFREGCRTTVFGYVRMLRMEKPWMMLDTGELNVSEVALATGCACFAISPGPSVNVLASRPELSRTGDGPEVELMFVIREHLTQRKIAEKLSEPDTKYR